MADPPVVPWAQVEEHDPALAADVAARFAAHPHHVLATLHADGRPRVNGTNVFVTDGRLWLGVMPGARRQVDLDHRAWCAVHSAPLAEDLPEGRGDARVEARAVRVAPDRARDLLASTRTGSDAADEPDASDDDGAAVFELLVASLSLIVVDGDALLVRSWSPATGARTVRRS